MSTTKSVKLTIIENYIDWIYSYEYERDIAKADASRYVKEDLVDEIAQAFPELDVSANSVDEEV